MKRFLLSAIAAVLFTPSSASAQVPVPATAPWPDSTAFESYMDGLIETYMEENHIAGATVGVVREGEPLLLKGYGYADVGRREKVDPDSTLFRIGSVSKMFVWTAVMQLMEQGMLDLNADINRYLTDFTIPDTYEEPVTLRHLMTHTAGFEEYFIGLFARDTTRLRPLGEILSEELPARVRPPATFASYSNHGTGIAAYIVEQITGQPFGEYVEEHFFEPLEMNFSTFRQPLPPALQGQMSKGYAFEGGVFKEKGFEYVPLAPVGAASATAAGMINFMTAHLQLGRFGGAAILDSATARLMQSPAFRHTARVNPMRYGFMDFSQNGVEIIGHGGDTFWFHSLMALFPAHDLGLFLSFNTREGGGKAGEVLRDFVDRYFPEGDLAADTLAMSRGALNRFAGDYRANRYPHKRLTYVVALLDTYTVSVTDDGLLKTMEDEEAHFWFPVDSLAFRETNSSRVMAFEENNSGEIAHMYLGELPIIAFEKIPFISSQKLHFTLFGAAGAAFLATLVYWPLAYFIRIRYRPGLSTNSPLSFRTKTVAWCNALSFVGFFIWLAILLSEGNGEAVVYGMSDSVKAALVLPLVSAALTVLMVFHTMVVWAERESGIWSRLWYTLLCLLSVTLLWQLFYWNLLGFQY